MEAEEHQLDEAVAALALYLHRDTEDTIARMDDPSAVLPASAAVYSHAGEVGVYNVAPVGEMDTEMWAGLVIASTERLCTDLRAAACALRWDAVMTNEDGAQQRVIAMIVGWTGGLYGLFHAPRGEFGVGNLVLESTDPGGMFGAALQRLFGEAENGGIEPRPTPAGPPAFEAG